MSARQPAAFGGIDLGGTKILSLVMTAEGGVLGRDRCPTEAQDGPDAVIGRMAISLRRAAAAASLPLKELGGVGVSAPGPCDLRRGLVTDPPNLPGWRDVPLPRILSEALGLPVLLENDATAAAYGEHRFGAGRPYRHLVFVTVSTGIGGGIIIDGSPYRGASGGAGEVGHTVIQEDGPPCGCGRKGCLEALASGTAIAREGTALLEGGRAPQLARLAAAGRVVDAETVYEAAENGDSDARAVIERAGHYLGLGFANLINLFNPEAIVVGGGLSRMGGMFLGPACAAIRERALPQCLADVTVVLGELGDEAGALGVVALAAEEHGK